MFSGTGIGIHVANDCNTYSLVPRLHGTGTGRRGSLISTVRYPSAYTVTLIDHK